MLQFYLTNDSDNFIKLTPATVGIRKFKGCCFFTPANQIHRGRALLTPHTCWQLFGFVPKPGEAWYVKPNKTGRGVIKERVELAYS